MVQLTWRQVLVLQAEYALSEKDTETIGKTFFNCDRDRLDELFYGENNNHPELLRIALHQSCEKIHEA